jgi:glycosyltransferase involved in cell wall biosynthesis
VKAVRICYLANASSVHTRKFVKYFVEKGHEIHVISFEDARIEGATVHVMKLPMLVKSATFPLKIVSIYRIKALINRIKPDILHAHYVTNYGLFGALCNFNPFVVTAWGSDVFIVPEARFVSMIKKYIAIYTLRKADLITSDSLFSNRTIGGFGVDEEKVKLIVLGVDLRLFHQIENSEEFKKELHIPQNCQVVISTRNLEPVYDVSTLIKAIPYVVDERPNTYFLIVGEGTLRHQLEELTSKLGVAKSVRFVGSVLNREMPRFLGASDIFVSTSLSDTRSVSLLEAMANGLPAVVTDLEGNKECVKEGVNGFLFAKGDFKVLAEKIIYLLRDEDTRRRFGIINRQYVEKEGSYEKEMGKMEKLYKGLVEAYNQNYEKWMKKC